MSLFSWFLRKPAPAFKRASEPSGRLNADAAVLPEQAAQRTNERMERRELLYVVVRDAMVRAGVLSASYKFKVLALDQRGRQFLVMMDLAREYGGETARLSDIEALIAQTAKLHYDIAVTAVYWRINDHVAAGIRQKGVAPQGAGLPAAPQPHRGSAPPASARPVGAAAPAPAVAPAAVSQMPAQAPASAAAAPARAAALRFDPIEADEVAAFKQALAAAAPAHPAVAAPSGVPLRSGPRRAPPGNPDFADTEVSGHSARSPDLSSTQYGDL
ncbi:hypothetical protein [Acidovorax sp. SRB_24]|uniref:hypothetical protein n=1 Tax=Acidovorax sp. SRB_24 TaxID=1962700 RepID=UPI00145C790A|nr:hypothetical protein [Acidovorax sp. SRB_24]NMM76687.1 hypothetical protein [Acidovorax sp. SRB_24]